LGILAGHKVPAEKREKLIGFIKRWEECAIKNGDASPTTHRNTQTTQADYQNNQQYLQLKANNRTEKHNISAQLSLVHNETPKNNNSELLDYSGHHTYSISSANQKKEDMM
jgi:hypothetical protein